MAHIFFSMNCLSKTCLSVYFAFPLTAPRAHVLLSVCVQRKKLNKGNGEVRNEWRVQLLTSFTIMDANDVFFYKIFVVFS